MTGRDEADFLYANRDGAWLDFARRDVELADGRLRLTGLPAPAAPLPTGTRDLPAPDGPAGLDAGPDGAAFFTDPARDTLMRIDACDGSQEPVHCLGGTGVEPTQLRGPRGLLVHAGRGALIVADTGNHRLQVFDLATLQLLDIWGAAGPGLRPQPGTEPGRFDTPTALAADASGFVYVVDRGNRRVQKFSAGGLVLAGFGDTLAEEANLADPVGIAVLDGAGGAGVYILDHGPNRLVVVDAEGHVRADHLLALDDPFGVAVVDGVVYVGDNFPGGGRVVRLRPDGSVLAAAPGFVGPVAALAPDGRGGMLVHTGSAVPPILLRLNTAFVRLGLAWGGPFGGFVPRAKAWQRVAATMGPLPAGVRAELFFATSDTEGAPPPVNEAGPDHFPEPRWSAGPPDVGQFVLRRPPARLAWVGIRFSSDGAHTPSIEQVRLEFDRRTYAEHLPAIYRDDQVTNSFLPRYLALAESLFSEVEDETRGLPRLADAAAAPAPLLAQLARWLAVDVSAAWDEAELRAAVARAYAESAWRGTAKGLRAALWLSTGVAAWIEEPMVQAAWWALAEDEGRPDAERDTSVLGVSTMLAAAEPQGAVLGSTATVDRSHLIESDDYGVPLFESFAYRFQVRVYRGAAYSTERLHAARAVLDRERPAHTEYTICDIDPLLAIGVQSRIGIDAIVGGHGAASAPTRLDAEGSRLGHSLVLGGDPPGRIGERSDIGITTRLTAAATRD